MLCSLRNDFFAASSCSTSPWGRLLSFSLFFFLHTMVHAQILHITSLGDLALVGLKKNEKLQAMAPLKTFLPSWKEKGAIEKMKKRWHHITHSIAEAHPHSKIWVCRFRPYPSIYKNRALTKILPKKDLPTSVATCPVYLGWPLSEAPDALVWCFSIELFYHATLLFRPDIYWCALWSEVCPFYSIFYYLIMSFVFCRSYCSYWPCLCFF
jgi:hypothetical protein